MLSKTLRAQVLKKLIHLIASKAFFQIYLKTIFQHKLPDSWESILTECESILTELWFCDIDEKSLSYFGGLFWPSLGGCNIVLENGYYTKDTKDTVVESSDYYYVIIKYALQYNSVEKWQRSTVIMSQQQSIHLGMQPKMVACYTQTLSMLTLFIIEQRKYSGCGHDIWIVSVIMRLELWCIL